MFFANDCAMMGRSPPSMKSRRLAPSSTGSPDANP
jgi:hypothetical protein